MPDRHEFIERSRMRQHKKNTQNRSLPDVVQPKNSPENFSHFPEEEIPNFLLVNEIGLSTNTRSIHKQVNTAGLLNQYPIRAYQNISKNPGSEEKSKLARELSGKMTNSFRDFRAIDSENERSNNISEVIWATGRENSTIQSKHEKSKGELPSIGRSISPKVKAER